MWWLILPLSLLQDSPLRPPWAAHTVVVSAATQPVPLDALARAVTVVTGHEIRRLPNASIADLLRLAASVEVRARGGFGAQTDLSVRGGAFGQALVLVDGVRMNDSQSGHHNGDIPVAIDQVDRIEIVRGTGSSLYGADAVTGAINIITRAPAARASVSAGQHGLVRGSGSASFDRGRIGVAAWGTRTSGFMFDRDVRAEGGSLTAAFTPQRRLAISHLRNAFGANGFYGPAPSKEWTDQTLVSFADAVGPATRRLAARAAYRTHGDHFLWDINRPGFAENRHRTHAMTAAATVRSGTSRNWVSAGVEAGLDWIRSNNLGDHGVQRGAALVEVQRALGGRTTIYPGLRYDRYSTFGDSWSPSIAAVVSMLPRWRVRGSAGRAFRVPTFTERYYRDPAHRAAAALDPERGWGAEAGIDWFADGWTIGATSFERRERDVIDWVRPTVQDQWQTANIRVVRTTGIEASIVRSWRRGFVRSDYAWLRSRAPSLLQLSKYVDDFAPHSVTAAAGADLKAVSLGLRADCKRKVDRRSYCGVDLRTTVPIAGVELFVEATNLFDVRYQEIKGVDMAPRWVSAGVQVRK